MDLRFSLFNVGYDDEIFGVTRQFSDDTVDAWRASLLARHHFGDGLAAEIQVPTGTVGAESRRTGAKRRLNGFGDIRLGLRYDLSAIWGAGGYRPSVVIAGALALPTGAQSRFTEVNSRIPVTVLALGRGAFAAGVRVEATQAVAKWMLLRGWLGSDLPLTPNGLGITNGLMVDAGAGVVGIPVDWLNLSASLVAQYLQNAQSPDLGEIENSGGAVLSGELSAGVRILDRTFVNVGVRAPAVAALNGDQVGETFSAFVSIAASFGGAEDEHDHGDGHDHGGDDKHGGGDKHGGDEHDHGGDEHDHGGGDKHGGDEHDHGGGDKHGGNEHDHGGDEHDHGGGDKHGGDEHDHGGDEHDHGGDEHRSEHPPKSGDIADAARGGASFVVADVLVPGKITVIDFWAEWCEPCKDVDALLATVAARHSSVAVRKVEVPTFDTQVAKDHVATARGLPVIWIYDAEGVRVHTFEAADLAALKNALRKEVVRAEAKGKRAMPKASSTSPGE